MLASGPGTPVAQMTWQHLWSPAQDLSKVKSVRNSCMEQRRPIPDLLLAEELLAAGVTFPRWHSHGRCPQEMTTHPGAYGQQWLDRVGYESGETDTQ